MIKLIKICYNYNYEKKKKKMTQWYFSIKIVCMCVYEKPAILLVISVSQVVHHFPFSIYYYPLNISTTKL